MSQPKGFPSRYEPLQQLGKGGGGEVWAARDRLSHDTVALKLLREGAEEVEMLALVREATVLSGVEGLGVPRTSASISTSSAPSRSSFSATVS